MGKSIGVISLKGGVGKTSVVAALGMTIAMMGKKVLLVDGNLSAPNLGMHFNIFHPQKTLHNVLGREINAKEAIHNLENLDVIVASMLVNKQVNPLKLKERMTYLKKKYDYVIYDSSPNLGDETLGVMLASDSLLVVTTPDNPTVSTTIKAVNLAKERGSPIDGVIINKVHKKKFEVPLEAIESAIDLPVIAVIPYDVRVLEALASFTSSIQLKPKSEASREYRRLASALVGQRENHSKFKKFFKWINPKKQEINRLILYKSVFK